ALVHGLDGNVLELTLEDVAQALAVDEAGAGEVEVEEAKHLAARQFAGELLERAERACHIAAADDGADRSAGDDIGMHTRGIEGSQHPDLRPPASPATPQCQSDLAVTHCRAPAHELRRTRGWPSASARSSLQA